MKKFVWCIITLAAVPMIFLNSMGREAFLGYYLGLIIMWLVAVFGLRQAHTKAVE